ncbi:MAG: glycosyltransferase family 4 protein [bacterium]
MKVGIDARFLTHPQSGGFKTYTENLVMALDLVDGTNTYVLYVDRSPVETALPIRDNLTYEVVEGTLPMLGMPIREQFSLPKHAAQDDVDMMHFPCLTAPLGSQCPFVLTLHDVIWLTERPGSLISSSGRSLRRWAMWFYNTWVPRLASRRARCIVAISHATKADIVRQLRIPSERISVVHNAVKPIFRPNGDKTLPAAIRHRHDLDQNQDFILGIGSADPRKNMTGLVRAYAKLPASQRARYKLYIVWTHSLLKNELLGLIGQLGLRSRVTFLEQVPDEDLVLLYNAATVFVFPSHYEGFGLPPLEAMACGTPVVAADNSSIPEVVGDASLLVDSMNVSALSTAIERVLDDRVLQAEMSQKGLARAEQFSLGRFGRETLEVYEKVLR